MKALRLIIYVFVLVAGIIFVEIKKESVRVERAREVESVLSIIGKQGLPIKVYKMSPVPFNKMVNLNLSLCENEYCFYASEMEKSFFSGGQKIFDATGGEVGNIISVSSQISPAIGLYQIRTQMKVSNFKNPVKVRINHLDQALVIPVEAVTQVRDEIYVYLYQEGKPVRRNITLGLMAQNEVVVTNGLNIGDVVIVEGVSQLNLFDKFNIVGEYEFTSGRNL